MSDTATTTPAHFLTIDDCTATELHDLLERADSLKRAQQAGRPHRHLPGATLTMVFAKPSTRTRVSFETGMTQLGGHAVFLGPDDIGLGTREPIRDTARVLGRYGDAVMARLFAHADIEELAAHASVPVINGLTDSAHPCQALADLFTLYETVGLDASVAWVGDGNNVARSFAQGCALLDVDLTVATPAAYGLDDAVLERTAALGTAPTTTTDPAAAIADADVVYTDVWVSMGQDRDDEKLAAFEDGGFRLTADRLGDRSLMHCLPANRGEEVTDAVLESDRSLAWRQAENRLHAQKALLVDRLA